MAQLKKKMSCSTNTGTAVTLVPAGGDAVEPALAAVTSVVINGSGLNAAGSPFVVGGSYVLTLGRY